MAYAESTIGGDYGGSFRVWVNSIRVYDGGPNENYEQWRVEGGINRVSASGNTIWSDGASYTTQLGLNGVAVSSGFSYNFNTALGTKISWGSGTTTVYRDGAGNGFGFQSRTDVNLNNGPLLTSGWVTSNDALITRYRHASLTGLSMDGGGIPATDEGPMWVEFYNPGNAAVDAFLEAPDGSNRIFTSPSGISSRYNFPFDAGLMAAFQAASPNSNTFTVRIGIHDTQGGESHDFRDRTYTIKNDLGQANPTFADFTYLDTNPATVAVTGSDQILVQNRSTLQTTIPAAMKATPNKQATMTSYSFLMGSYSQSEPWSGSADVVKLMGIPQFTGTQNLSVRAIDSRGNSTTVTKAVTILPYLLPGFYQALTIKYDNDFDASGGLSVSLLNDETLAAISPMNLNGVNKNSIHATTGLQYDISKSNNTTYSGVWKDIPTTTAANGWVNTDPAALADDIFNEMIALGEDNTVKWYIKFRVTDALDSNTFETSIDIGRPIFRIGTDGILYYREFPMSSPAVQTNTTLSSISPDAGLYGTFVLTALASSLTIGAPTGAFEGKRILFVIKDNGASRALTWNSAFVPIGVSLPATTSPGKWMYVGALYNATAGQWHVIGVNIQG